MISNSCLFKMCKYAYPTSMYTCSAHDMELIWT